MASVNEIFNPDRVTGVYEQDPVRREEALVADRATNYGVVRINLLEHIYETLYTQRLYHRSEEAWPHRILPYRHVTQVSHSSHGGVNKSNAVRLHVQNDSALYMTDAGPREELMEFDAVFVASGYRREAHQEMLADSVGLMPKQDREERGGKWRVNRDYGIIFDEGKVAPDAGIWLQGCCEKTHGVSSPTLESPRQC
jgi:L-ornithine N5-monooxygenase